MKKQIIFILILLIFSFFSETGRCFEYESFVVYTEWSPKSVLISPDGKKAYVLNLESCSVTVYNTSTRELLYTIYFPQTYGLGWDYETETSIDSIAEKPVEGAFTGNGRYLWISLHNASSVVVYDTSGKGFDPSAYPSTMEVTIKDKDENITYRSLLKIPVERTPKVIAVSPDEKTVAVANWHGLSVSIIDAKKFKVIKTIPVSEVPRGMVFSRDGSLLYVAIMYGDYLEIINTSSWKITGKVKDVGPAPRHLIIDKKGKYIYCSVNQGGNVVKIDTSAGKVVASVYVDSTPRTIEFSPDEKNIYVCSYASNMLYILDTQTFQVIHSLPAGANPVGMDVSPSGEVWVTNQGDGTVSVFKIKY